MALRELLLPWDAQPQEAVRIDPTLNPVLGFSAPFGFNDIVDGSYYTAAGSGLSIGVNNYGREMDGGGAGMLKRPIAAPAGHPYTFIGIARQDGSGGTKCVSSLATSADKCCRVFLTDGDVLAQHSGATTYANALTTQVFYYGTSAIVVAAFDSPSSVRVWARGLKAEAYAENTTNVGSLPALTHAAVMGYSGSVDISQLDGGVTLAAWLRLSPTEQQAREWLANPWQLFEPRRIFVPVVAGGGGSFSATGALSSDASTLSGTATHLTLHASSGALSSDASTIAGSANHIVVHPSSGALSSQDATLAGTALRYRQFSATGALDSASATIAGDAAHTTTGTFSATGALSAQDGTIAGTATHLTLHTATGAIQASDSTITGTAARLGTHDATGSLSADLASITGTVLHTGDGAEVVPLRTGGHAFMRERFAQARKRLALQRILSYLTEEEPAEETKRIIRAVKAGKPIQDKKPPVVMAEVSAEKIAEKLIPSRVADLAEIPDIDMQAVIKKAIRLAQERDDEDVLLLL